MNAFKQAIQARRAQIGLWQSLTSPVGIEICGGAGFDWLLIDGEHAPNDVPLILAQLQALAPFPVEPVVRIPVGERTIIKQVLDLGARSLLVPMIENADDARAMVRATRYPPHGERGVGYGVSRASQWGRIRTYAQQIEDDLCLLLQVENEAGLRALDEIVAVPGIDGVFIGPADLAASLGHLGNSGHPDVQAAVDGAIATVVKGGKAAGILTVDEGLARRYLEMGATFVAVGSDVLLLAAAVDALAGRFAA